MPVFRAHRQRPQVTLGQEIRVKARGEKLLQESLALPLMVLPTVRGHLLAAVSMPHGTSLRILSTISTPNLSFSLEEPWIGRDSRRHEEKSETQWKTKL